MSKEANLFKTKYFRDVLGGKVGRDKASGKPIDNRTFLATCERVSSVALQRKYDDLSRELLATIVVEMDMNEEGLLKMVQNDNIASILGEWRKGVIDSYESANPVLATVNLRAPEDDPLYG